MFIKNHKKKKVRRKPKKRSIVMYMKTTCILSKLENYVSCVEKWKKHKNFVGKESNSGGTMSFLFCNSIRTFILIFHNIFHSPFFCLSKLLVFFFFLFSQSKFIIRFFFIITQLRSNVTDLHSLEC